MSLLPNILWAQRKDRVYVTIDLQDARDPQINLTNDDAGGKLTFSAPAHSHAVGPEEHEYSTDLSLYGAIDPDDSKVSKGSRSILLVLAKKEEGFWPRLQREAGKPRNIKVDWSKWVDEDDDEPEAKEDFDLSAMQNFTNFDMGASASGGGLGALDDDSEEDDDELPPLESAA